LENGEEDGMVEDWNNGLEPNIPLFHYSNNLLILHPGCDNGNTDKGRKYGEKSPHRG
jgi:hypothetical protein